MNGETHPPSVSLYLRGEYIRFTNHLENNIMNIEIKKMAIRTIIISKGLSLTGSRCTQTAELDLTGSPNFILKSAIVYKRWKGFDTGVILKYDTYVKKQLFIIDYLYNTSCMMMMIIWGSCFPSLHFQHAQ